MAIGAKMLYIILLMQRIFQKECKQIIYYYPVPKKKSFTQNLQILTPKEVNSGVTFLENRHNHDHMNGKIILFREEEVFKVLIHELIHSFHLDYELVMHSMRLKNDLCSNYPILLNEAYTEAFATMINLYLVYWEKRKSKKGKEKEEKENKIESKEKKILQKMFRAELTYELGLARKILQLNGMKSADLWKLVKDDTCLKRFMQQTNVFSYYILKPLLLSNMEFYDRFMTQYTRNGVIQREGIQILENYIVGLLRDPNSSFVKLLKSSQEHNTRTLRMVYWKL